MQLAQKVAIVTGGATGIGQAIAIGLANAGAAVLIDYVGAPDAAQSTVESITAHGGTAAAFAANVASADQVNALVAHAVTQFGRLDILVNNAGIEEQHPFLEMPQSVWDKVIAVNLTGPWLCAQAAARQMVQQGGGGRIINISSVHEDLPMPTNAPYCASKGGLRMMMRTICLELAPHQITVNNIGPGAIDTPMDAPLKQDSQKMAALLAEIPLGRMGQPEDIAAMAVFLASDAAAYITGSTFFVDGGMLRQAGAL